MFPAYIERPVNFRFEGQDADEKILLLLRAHPITNLPWIFFALLLILSPFFIPILMSLTGFSLNLIPQTFQLMFLIIICAFTFVIVYEGFLYWYFNVTLITSNKIIDVDFEQLLYKGVDLAPLSKIEETDSLTMGIIGTIFNFGNVSVQTAGAKVAIEMRNIPKPTLVADMVLDLAGKGHHAN